MGKRSVPLFQKLSNTIKISIFMAKMRLIHLKRSTNFKPLNHYNSYGFLKERQFSPSSTPLISFHCRKMKLKGNYSLYSIRFLSCFSGRHHHHHHGVVVDENYYSFESAIVEVDRDGMELEVSYYGVEEEEEDDGSVDERAERFIERFYEDMKRQRIRESLSSSDDLPFNRMLKY